jgi:intracellular sulfur oxidation DsrE/DsrF family protein
MIALVVVVVVLLPAVAMAIMAIRHHAGEALLVRVMVALVREEAVLVVVANTQGAQMHPVTVTNLLQTLRYLLVVVVVRGAALRVLPRTAPSHGRQIRCVHEIDLRLGALCLDDR